MGGTPEPPLYADLLQVVLILALAFLIAYSIRFRHFLRGEEKYTELPFGANSKSPGEMKTQAKIQPQFYIEPSPVPDQKVPYPTLPRPELDLSVIVLAQDIEDSITTILESFTDYLAIRDDFQYEIIVVDMNSSDSTRSASLTFASSHQQVRILHIPFKSSPTFAIATAFVRARGDKLFLYNPNSKVPVETLSEFERKLVNGLREDRDVVVVGSPSSFTSTNSESALSSTLAFLKQWLLSWLTKEQQCVNCGTFLLTRGAAATIGMTIQNHEYAFDFQMLIIAWKHSMALKTVRLTSYKMPTANSQELLDDTVAILKSFFMYATNMWPIRPQ